MNQKCKLATNKQAAGIKKPAFQTQKTDLSRSLNSPINEMLKLQRTIGNKTVQRMFQSGVIRTKLKIGLPGDKYEQEANKVRDQVLQMPESQLQRQPEEEEKKEEEYLQAKGNTDQISEVTSDLESRIQSLRGVGQPLSKSVRNYFEPRFGYDFNQVRIHTDAQAMHLARTINAKAFTIGSKIVFGSGQYAPEMPSGKRLLAHELTHVLQQYPQKPLNNILKQHLSNPSKKSVLQRKIEVKTEKPYLPLSPESLDILPPKQRWALKQAEKRAQAEKGFQSFINSLLQEGINRSRLFKEIYKKLHLDKKNRTLTIEPGTAWSRMAFDDKYKPYRIIVDMLKIVDWEKNLGATRNDHIEALFHELDHAHQCWFYPKEWSKAKRKAKIIIEEKERKEKRKLSMAERHELHPEEKRVSEKVKKVAKELKENPNPSNVLITIGPEWDEELAEVEKLKIYFEKEKAKHEMEMAYRRAMEAYWLLKEVQRRKRELNKGKKESLDKLDRRLKKIGEELHRIWE